MTTEGTPAARAWGCPSGSRSLQCPSQKNVVCSMKSDSRRTRYLRNPFLMNILYVVTEKAVCGRFFSCTPMVICSKVCGVAHRRPLRASWEIVEPLSSVSRPCRCCELFWHQGGNTHEAPSPHQREDNPHAPSSSAILHSRDLCHYRTICIRRDSDPGEPYPHPLLPSGCELHGLDDLRVRRHNRK